MSRIPTFTIDPRKATEDDLHLRLAGLTGIVIGAWLAGILAHAYPPLFAAGITSILALLGFLLYAGIIEKWGSGFKSEGGTR